MSIIGDTAQTASITLAVVEKLISPTARAKRIAESFDIGELVEQYGDGHDIVSNAMIAHANTHEAFELLQNAMLSLRALEELMQAEFDKQLDARG